MPLCLRVVLHDIERHVDHQQHESRCQNSSMINVINNNSMIMLLLITSPTCQAVLAADVVKEVALAAIPAGAAAVSTGLLALELLRAVAAQLLEMRLLLLLELWQQLELRLQLWQHMKMLLLLLFVEEHHRQS